MGLDPNARDKSQHEQQPGEAVALNYIDKVHASLTKQWDAMSRSLTVQTVISLITVAICIGAVTPKEKFSLFGLGLTASIKAVLIGSTFLIATFHVMTFGSYNRAVETGFTLTDLYDKAGYRDETMDDSVADPFGAAAPIYTLLFMSAREIEDSDWFTNVFTISLTIAIWGGLAYVLPVAAELAALVKVASLMGWGENLLWVVLLIPIVVSVACDIWYART
jgi:hypothetical protein